MTLLIRAGEQFAFGLSDGGRQLDGLALTFRARPLVGLLLIGEQLAEMRLDRKARGDRIEGGIGLDLGGVEVQLLAPDQAGLTALLALSAFLTCQRHDWQEIFNVPSSDGGSLATGLIPC